MTTLPHDLDVTVVDDDGDSLAVKEFDDSVIVRTLGESDYVAVALSAKQARKVGIRLIRMAARIEARDIVARCS